MLSCIFVIVFHLKALPVSFELAFPRYLRKWFEAIYYHWLPPCYYGRFLVQIYSNNKPSIFTEHPEGITSECRSSSTQFSVGQVQSPLNDKFTSNGFSIFQPLSNVSFSLWMPHHEGSASVNKKHFLLKKKSLPHHFYLTSPSMFHSSQ